MKDTVKPLLAVRLKVSRKTDSLEDRQILVLTGSRRLDPAVVLCKDIEAFVTFANSSVAILNSEGLYYSSCCHSLTTTKRQSIVLLAFS
jgi:hypothetical protein